MEESVEGPRWRASVIIPAHDEERVIGRCLDSLAVSASSRDWQVVVVANGCGDATAAVAREYLDRLPGLRVLELAVASKAAALNAGDVAVTALPRVFLDADIEMRPGAMEHLLEALDREDAPAACPAVEFDTSVSSGMVRAFYRIFARLPYASENLLGLGVYGLSVRGRARFDVFPDITSDDLFVQRLFTPSEVLTTTGSFLVRAPRTTTDLVRVRTRVAQGSAELASADLDVEAQRTTRVTLRALARVVRQRPWLVPDAFVYAVVTLRARAEARRRRPQEWLRDASTRT